MHSMKSKSKKYLFTAALFALAAAVLYSFLFLQIKQKNRHISALLHTIEQSATEEQRLVSLKMLVSETVSMREKLGSYRVAKDDAVAFISELEALGREIGLAVTTISVEVSPREGAHDGSENLRLVLRFEGGWGDVVRYLGLLELLPVEGSIEQALLTRKSTEDKASPSLWRGDATLVVLKET